MDELFQFSSSLPYQEQPQVADELEEILFAPSPPDWNIPAVEDILGGPPSVEPLAAPLGGTSAEPKRPESSKKRKTVHRDVERQRRQEMASLYGSLRSHLPVEILKGKRSISDHIYQAIGYIKNLQRKIQVLSDKRDEMKRVSDSKKIDDPKTNKEESPRPRGHQDVVTIEPCIGGIEITISTDLKQGVALSKVLGFLIREGMTLISCASTVVNERLLHSIKSEVIGDDGSEIENLSALREKLMNLSR
ncbi:hypothetical protein CRG98_040642 [Punica granatum]|nr:hypothetical protein CRG98_040642 [Punica granatum]